MEKQPLPKRRYTLDEAEVIEKVRSDYNSAKTSRETGCYWGAPSTTGDWEQRWDLQEKINMGWAYKKRLTWGGLRVQSKMSLNQMLNLQCLQVE